MTFIQAKQLVANFIGVGEVAIVRQSQTIRRIDIKWLGFFQAIDIARRRIAHMTDAHITE